MSNIRYQLHEELVSIDQDLVSMGGLVRTSLEHAVQAYVSGDCTAAESVLDCDDEIDHLEEQVETICLRTIAFQQLIARDLRRVSSAIKICFELERAGDHSVQIAKNTRKLCRQSCVRPLIDLGAMAQCSLHMIGDSLAAYLNDDLALACKVCEDDDFVDEEYKKHREELLRLAQADASVLPFSSYTLLIITSLERVADHATNIAERVAFIQTGQFKRLAREHRLRSLSSPY